MTVLRCLFTDTVHFVGAKAVFCGFRQVPKARRQAPSVEIAAVEQKQVGIEDYLLAKHYNRKHGKNAYYGQK